LVLRAERALKAATKLQPSATVDAAIKQLDARAAALRKQQASLRATLQSLRPTPAKPKPKAPAKPKAPSKPARHADKDKRRDNDKGKDRDKDTAGVRLPMTLTAAHKPQPSASGSHRHASVTVHRHASSGAQPPAPAPTKAKAPTTTVQHKPTATGTGHQILVCPLASSGNGSSSGSGSLGGCPPPRPCVQWGWQCHRPRCGPLPRFNNTGVATRLWPWCWPVPPSPCGGPLKAPTAAAPSIICIGPLGANHGTRVRHHTGGSVSGAGTGTVVTPASGSGTLVQAPLVPAPGGVTP